MTFITRQTLFRISYFLFAASFALTQPALADYASNHQISNVGSTTARLSATLPASRNYAASIQAQPPSQEGLRSYGASTQGTLLVDSLGNGLTTSPLTPNTPYRVTLQFSGFSPEPTPPLFFNTKPGNLSLPVPPTVALVPKNYSVILNWADNTNPWWTTYEIEFCYDGPGPVNVCRTVETGSKGTSPSNNPSAQTFRITHAQFTPGLQIRDIKVRALNYSKSPLIDSNLTPNGDYLLLGNTTLTQNGPYITSIAAIRTGTQSISLTANLGGTTNASQITVRWSVNCALFPNYHVNLAQCRQERIVFDRNNYQRTANLTIPVTNTLTIGNGGNYTFTLEIDDGINEPERRVAETLVIFADLRSFEIVPTRRDVGTRQTTTFELRNPLDDFGDLFGNLFGASWTLPANAPARFGPANQDLGKTFVGGPVATITMTATSADVGSSFQVSVSSRSRAGSDEVTRQATIFIAAQSPSFTACGIHPDGVLETEAFLSATAIDPDSGSSANIGYRYNVTRAPNGSNRSRIEINREASGRIRVANLQRAGGFTVEVIAFKTNGQDISESCSIDFNIVAVPKRVVVTPPEAFVLVSRTQTFVAEARDQFDQGVLREFNWTSGSTVGPVSPRPGASRIADFTPQRFTGRFEIRAIDTLDANLIGVAFASAGAFDVSNSRAYPVPFRGDRDTEITFACFGSDADIRIYTASGRLVREFNNVSTALSDPNLSCQGYQPWNVRNSDGERLASGVYLYIIKSRENKKEGKIIIIW